MNFIDTTATGDSLQCDTERALLRFRRQFFLGRTGQFSPPGWSQQRLDADRCIVAHPDLALTQVRHGGRACTLLGFLLDPARPQASNRDIVQDLLERHATLDALVAATSPLGGRWALVLQDGARTVVCHDATGLRQVSYARTADHGAVCASHPGLLAQVLALQPDPAVLDYIGSRGESDFEVYWLPGDRTLYREVRALLPNHTLDLQTGLATRHGPGAGPLSPLSVREAAARCLATLRGLLDAARRRAPLAVSMTAGWDSRLVLALSQPVRDQLYCFTLTYPHLSLASRDVAVPARLLKQLGLQHHLIGYPTRIDPGFKALFRQSTPSGSTAYCADAQAMHAQYPQDHLCLTGDVAEIVKCFYRLPGVPDHAITPQQLAEVCRLEPHPLVLEALAEWRAGVPADSAVPLLDLFNWEQMAGRWQAQIRAEYDIAQESFAPLNCRDLLLTMLAVDEAERQGPAYPFFRALIEQLWPEVLNVPINPPETTSLKRRVLRALGSTPLYRLIPRQVKDGAKRLLQAAN
ncbi:hypothetical protein [Sphaerotilus sp.]|uniref:hypothetical protein n=1 Tax=Sphaerotilus sp. TaxID=2093942 RepID=UPI0034E2A578